MYDASVGIDDEGPFIGIEPPLVEEWRAADEVDITLAELLRVFVDIDVDVGGPIGVVGAEFAQHFDLGAAEGVGAEAGACENDHERTSIIERSID